MKKNKSQNLVSNNSSVEDKSIKKKYSAPEILSVERLEAAAVACSLTGPTLGKTFPSPCATLGS